MTTTTTTPDVPLPAGAVRAHEWDSPQITGYEQASRYFVGTRRTVQLKEPVWDAALSIDRGGEDIEVILDGTQWADGRAEWSLSMNDTPLTPAQARELAAALFEAADELYCRAASKP